MRTLRGLYRGLEALYGADTGVDPASHLHLFAAAEGRGQEALFVREADDGELEVGLAIDRELLARVEARAPDEVLADGALADALPVIEGLSHLLYIAEAARRERPVSPLELETQAEVDKLALCLFDRRGHAPARYDALVDRLFYRFTLADDLTPELRDRYETANRLALAFARRLDRDVREGRWSRLRRTLQAFWGGTFEAKLGLAR
ncbi:MAG: hypothetical protein H6710_11715 [Myxococcales bacterium]|nr:hypothetical protein [Myxococcales bacterium]